MTTTVATGHPNGQMSHRAIKIGEVVPTHEDTVGRKSVTPHGHVWPAFDLMTRQEHGWASVLVCMQC